MISLLLLRPIEYKITPYEIFYDNRISHLRKSEYAIDATMNMVPSLIVCI